VKRPGGVREEVKYYPNNRHRPRYAGDPNLANRKMGHPDALRRAPGDDEMGLFQTNEIER
jgi:hypothetical protein